VGVPVEEAALIPGELGRDPRAQDDRDAGAEQRQVEERPPDRAGEKPERPRGRHQRGRRRHALGQEGEPRRGPGDERPERAPVPEAEHDAREAQENEERQRRLETRHPGVGGEERGGEEHQGGEHPEGVAHQAATHDVGQDEGGEAGRGGEERRGVVRHPEQPEAQGRHPHA
jgi:hypothetical protein